MYTTIDACSGFRQPWVSGKVRTCTSIEIQVFLVTSVFWIMDFSTLEHLWFAALIGVVLLVAWWVAHCALERAWPKSGSDSADRTRGGKMQQVKRRPHYPDCRVFTWMGHHSIIHYRKLTVLRLNWALITNLMPRLHGSGQIFCTDKNLHGSTLRLQWTGGTRRILEKKRSQTCTLSCSKIRPVPPVEGFWISYFAAFSTLILKPIGASFLNH